MSHDFDSLMQRFRSGSPEAAWELTEKYASKLLRVVRRELPDALRQKFDSQDFVQVVWASIFKRPERIGALGTADELGAYLAGVATKKVLMEKRRWLVGLKRNINKEVNDSDGKVGETFEGSEPAPEEVAIARERFERMMSALTDELRQIVHLRLAGHTAREIAKQVGKHEGTINRALRKIEDLSTE